MKNVIQQAVCVEYDLLLIDENINRFPKGDNISIRSSSIEFVPDLEQNELREIFVSKSNIHSLYLSYDPSKLIVASQCGIDTCFLNKGNNDTIDFKKTYEIPAQKILK